MKNFLGVLVVAAALACGGGSKNVRGGGGTEGTPEWVQRGSGAFGLESGRKLEGVGTANAPDPKARRKAADAAAHQQLLGTLDALSAALTKMSESTKDNLGDAISAISRKAAAAAQHVRDHYVTPDGSEAALEMLDLGAFKQALQSVDGDDNIRREMSNNVDRAFDQLAKQ